MIALSEMDGITCPAHAKLEAPVWWISGIPPEIQEFYERFFSGAGYVGGGYIDMWPADELEILNERALHDLRWKKYLFFAGNGAGEQYGFTVEGEEFVFVVAPAISTDVEDIKKIGEFNAFLKFVNGGGDIGEIM